jgi:hypothetical protein
MIIGCWAWAEPMAKKAAKQAITTAVLMSVLPGLPGLMARLLCAGGRIADATGEFII